MNINGSFNLEDWSNVIAGMESLMGTWQAMGILVSRAATEGGKTFLARMEEVAATGDTLSQMAVKAAMNLMQPGQGELRGSDWGASTVPRGRWSSPGRGGRGLA